MGEVADVANQDLFDLPADGFRLVPQQVTGHGDTAGRAVEEGDAVSLACEFKGIATGPAAAVENTGIGRKVLREAGHGREEIKGVVGIFDEALPL